MIKYLKASIMIAAVFAFFTGAPYAHANETIQWGTTRTDADPVGNGGTFVQFAQQFTAAGSFDTASTSLCVATNGTISGNFVVTVQADLVGLPSGTDLSAGSSLPNSTFGTTVVPCAGTFHWPNITVPTQSAGTYWLVFSSTATPDPTNVFYISLADGGSPSLAAYNGIIWRTTTLGTSKNWVTGLVDLSLTATPAKRIPPLLLQWTVWW